MYLRNPTLTGWFALLLLVTGTLPAVAQETTLYDIEVIIFTQPGQGINSEQWTRDPARPKLEGARELQPPASSPKAQLRNFQQLHRQALRLSAEKDRLRARGYKPLAHLAWRQPGLGKAHAVPVRVRVEDPQANNSAGATLEGTLTLVLSRYLHLHADLTYVLPLEQSALGSQPDGTQGNSSIYWDGTLSEDGTALPVERVRIFRMDEWRRMRSRELHYLDHPVIGVVALVTPYTP